MKKEVPLEKVYMTNLDSADSLCKVEVLFYETGSIWLQLREDMTQIGLNNNNKKQLARIAQGDQLCALWPPRGVW